VLAADQEVRPTKKTYDTVKDLVTHSGRVDCEMRTALPATLQAVEEFFVEFRRRSQALMDRANCFAAELLVREALTNSVVHGCHADPSKQVRCFLRLKNRRLLIAVEDDGEGFDWRAAWRNTSQFPDCSGRGIEILRKYASRVRYSARGNLVTIIKRF
jgi:anti-sigma regulatory factor (Ser/Thr protein kinase)